MELKRSSILSIFTYRNKSLNPKFLKYVSIGNFSSFSWKYDIFLICK